VRFDVWFCHQQSGRSSFLPIGQRRRAIAGFHQDRVRALMLDELSKVEAPTMVNVVVFGRSTN
jgi:hypothetical protein